MTRGVPSGSRKRAFRNRHIKRTGVIFGTAASLIEVFSGTGTLIPSVTTLQIDETSHFAMRTLISLGARCHKARLAFIGDVQLDPYADRELLTELKDTTSFDVKAQVLKEDN
uniref:DeoRC domain-containing protein n=1 Tax=Caenorhabditis tropicalis TaxID=1561998 RepID=A0A1I7UX44_9PELO